MTVQELKARLESKTDETIQLVDVREPDEYAFASLAQHGSLLIPLGDLTQRASELDPDRETVVLCHHGIRSAHAVAFLRHLGFEKVRNLRGGIDQWSLAVDPSVPRY
jgi:rhodanese-related sulfurtransferase